MDRYRALMGTAVFAMAICGAVGPAGAQRRGGFAGGPGGPGRPFPPGMFGNMSNITGVDPSRSAMLDLLQRDDVIWELNLDLNQKSAIQSLRTTSTEQIMQKMREVFQANRQNRGSFRNMTPEERQQQQTQMQQQRQGAMDAAQADLETNLAKILNPRQMARLKQLDLQYRGPLALADAHISEPLALAPQQRGAIEASMQTYRTAQRTAMRSLFAGMQLPPRQRQPGGGGPPVPPATAPGQSDQAAPPAPPTPEEMAARRDAARTTVEAARKAEGDKVLALLSPEQRQQWAAMQGKPFHFRTMDNNTNTGQGSIQ